MSSSVGMMTWPQYDGKVMSSSHVPVTTNQILWFSHGFPMVFPRFQSPPTSYVWRQPDPHGTHPQVPARGFPCPVRLATAALAVALWPGFFYGKRQLFTTLDLGFSSKFAKQKKKSWDHWDKLGRHQVLWLIDMLIWSYTIIIVHWQIQ